MKVLLVGYVYGDGGVQKHTLGLGQGLAARGHRVTIATPSPMHIDATRLPIQSPLNIVSIDQLGRIFLGRYPGGLETEFDCAVIVGTGWKSMLGPLLNRRIKKRVFFEVMSGLRNGPVDPRMLVHLGFDAVVGQGRPVEAKFRESFGWRGRSTTIPALSDPLELVADLTLPVRAPPVRGALKACYFGRLARHKGVGWLLERWDAFDAHIATLDVWGTGDDADTIRASIAARGLQERVRMLGRFPGGADYAALLLGYDVELLPTFGQEGAPLVLLEAMACGLPFVANGMGGIPDYANPDCRVTSGDLAEFVPAFDSLAAALYAGDIDRARLQRHYLAHFSYRALCDRWEDFLLDLTGEKRVAESA